MQLGDKFTIIIPPQDISVNPDCLSDLAGGDRKAFKWLYENYSKKIFGYAMLITGDEHESEDIVQDVFLTLWRKKEKLKAIENFNNYIFIVTRNVTVSIMRKNALVQLKLPVYADAMTVAGSPHSDMEYKELLQLITKAVDRLPRQQKLVYQLKKECDWKRAKIASVLNVTPATIKSHLKVGVRSVRNYVKNGMN